MRDIPEYTAEVFFPKRTKYVLLIPLFNEGKRYLSQVEKMRENHVFDKVDVVICDAGSSDGTTEPEFLKKTGHRSLIIKKKHGAGGVVRGYSTDLKMGYDWALSEGYTGFITVDGNDKDDTKAMDMFIQKLDAGFDYIQGSRFVRGGKGINTPWIRYWALKLINEPVMTFCARKHLTDTTNGFRAYSREFLTDSRVLPFRPCFWGYELIYYLPIRACRLGFRICEVPVTRAYPKGETPSKVGGIRGNMYQLSILWHSFRKHYNPESSYQFRQKRS